MKKVFEKSLTKIKARLRGALDLLSMRGWALTAMHFAAVWGGRMIMLPALKVAPLITKQKSEQLAIDGLHHLMYAVATGLIFDAINKKSPASKYLKK